MRFVRKTLALVAWLLLYIPTTVFVTLVMVRLHLQGPRGQREGSS